jgi:hypothetical protein
MKEAVGMLEELLILLCALIIILVILLLLLKLKLEKRKVDKWSLIFSMYIQSVLILIWNSAETNLNMYFYLLAQSFFSIFYVIVDKELKLEDNLIAINREDKKKFFKPIIKTFLGFSIVGFRWCEVMLSFIFPLEFYSLLINDKGFTEVLNATKLLSIILFIFPVIFDFFSFSTNIKKKYVNLIFAFVLFIGLLGSKWWTGISLFSTVIGMALSEDFFRKNTNLSLSDEFDDSFFRMVIPCTTLIIYLCLIIIQDILPREIVINLINIINRSEMDVNSFGGKISISLFLGLFEIMLFGIIWSLIRRFIRKSTVINDNFKKQFFSTETIIKDGVKKKTVRRAE